MQCINGAGNFLDVKDKLTIFVMRGSNSSRHSLKVLNQSDFKKAFDSIDRKVMFAILRHYGIPEAVVNAVCTLYNNPGPVP